MLGEVSRRRGPPTCRGFTLIEAMVTIAILGILLAIAVPSLLDWIIIQRVKASAAEMLTDVKFARGEAVKRNVRVVMAFQTVPETQSCYTIHTQYDLNEGPCRCSKGEGKACDQGVNLFSDTLVELKTVSLLERGRVRMTANRILRLAAATGIPTSTLPLRVDFDGQDGRTLSVVTNATGRALVCAPAGSRISGYPACS